MPKTKYTKEMILSTALKIAIDEGLLNVSVRKIAANMGSSTAPIYTAFANTEELLDSLREDIINLLLEVSTFSYTPGNFLNIGVGVLVFARDYKNLYKDIFIDNPRYALKNSLKEEYIKVMKKDKLNNLFTEDELESLLAKMWIFTHGMATLICSDYVKNTSTEYFIKVQEEVGEEIIFSMLTKNGKADIIIKDAKKRGEKFESSNFRWDLW